MITASARTNAVGKTVSGFEELVSLTCKTDSFIINKPPRGGELFLDAKLYSRTRSKSHQEIRVIQDLSKSRNDALARIGDSLIEMGYEPETCVRVMAHVPDGKKTETLEVWTESERFKVDRGRVYGHKLLVRRSPLKTLG